MIDLQLAKMDAAHRQSQPSHINLILRSDADLSLLPAIKALPGVADVDTLTPITVRYQLPGQADWQMATLMLRPPTVQQRYDLTTLAKGNWPEAAQVSIENLSAKYTGLKLADHVQLEAVDDTITLPITGIVRHPFVKPPKFGGQTHFFGSSALASQFGVKPNSFRQLLVQITPPYSNDKARDVAKSIRTLLNNQHIGVNVTLMQDPEQHWGRPFFAGINNILQLMALASLVLASVLIFNTVSAHITQQTQQIGVLKALGASMGGIIKLYLLETLLLALMADLLAIPLALLAAYLSSCQLLGLFNIECSQFAYSPRALYLMVLGGLLAPLLAAIIPIWRGAAMSIRQAIASYGLGSDFGRSFFDRWLEKLGEFFLSSFYAAALGNLFRRKGRLLLTQSVLVIAGVMFLVLMSLIASVNLTLDNEMARSRYSVRLGFSRDQPGKKIIELAKSVPTTTNLELWQRHPIEIMQHEIALRQKGSLGVQMVALPATSSMYQPLIDSGRWFNAEDAGKPVLVLSSDTARLNRVKPGDSVFIRLGATQQSWRVIGLYRWLVGNSYAVEPVYAPLETVQTLTRQPDLVTFALLNAAIETPAQETAYLSQLKQTFENNAINLDVYTTQAKLEQRQFARNQFKPVIGMLFGLAVMIAAVGGIGLSGTLAISVLQRTREIGVLRAIGAPSKAIFRLFMLEGLLHGGVAWLISVPIAYYSAAPIAKTLGQTLFGIQLDYRFNLNAVGYWWVIVMFLAWLAAYLPARNAAKLTVRQCLSD